MFSKTLGHPALWLFAFCIALAAAANVPFAVMRLRSRTTPQPAWNMHLTGSEVARPWPADTPHATPWPLPNLWLEYRAFGYRYIDARVANAGRSDFSMTVVLVGWPFPVLEDKQMWWDWNNPAFKGPESDPAIRLRFEGLFLNPLIVGGGVYLVLVAPILTFLAVRSRIRCWHRLHHGLCLFCGYDLRSHPAKRCPECGGVSNRTEPE